MTGSRIVRGVALGTLALLSSCAWSNRDNRPVWNAFEETLVPESQGWFIATLPATVPLGLGSIVVDTVIAHPIQVIDDAFGDAADLWEQDDFEWQDEYYTEMAGLPLRAVVTPIVFLGSFLGRSIFDIRAPVKRKSKAEREAERAEHERKQAEARRKAFIGWLQAPGSGEGAMWVKEWHPSYDEPMRAALAADAVRRLKLHNGMLRGGITSIGNYDGSAGLRDPDPVVRYTCVKYWPRNKPKPEAQLIQALWNDPVEAVRLLARKRFRR